jgi:hypothetical protein
MSAKQSALSFRIEEAMKIALDQAAAEDWWPTANLCALILENWLRDHNRLLAPKRIFRAEARAAIVNRKLRPLISASCRLHLRRSTKCRQVHHEVLARRPV